MATDRTALRASLQRKTDGQLTNSTDQDVYLNLADRQVQMDWVQFDQTILIPSTRTSGTTDANGVLLLTANTVEVQRIENSNKVAYQLIDINDRWTKSGYYYAGMGNSNTQRQVVIVENGTPLASATVYFYVMVLSLMGSGTSAEPVIPEEFRDMIATRSTKLWNEDQGETFLAVADKWEQKYQRDLEKARRAYRRIDDQPIFARSTDPDAGGNGTYVIHRTS